MTWTNYNGNYRASESNYSNGYNNKSYNSYNKNYEQRDEYSGIRNVWKGNLYEEFKAINHAVREYQWIAMDTEFPGVVARPIGEFKSSRDYQYQLLKVNVDLLKVIQLGLTFMDEDGNLRPEISTWQFNFKFSLSGDMYAEESVELLKNSGINFHKHETEGVDAFEFAELLMCSGIVLNDEIKFLSFHSGFDFGYLIKNLTNMCLPPKESEFFELLRIYFPNIYDVKYIMKSCKDLKGGLQEIADQLQLKRVGPQHQAGSDSLLTGAAFFKMRVTFFEDSIEEEKYCGQLYGHGVIFSPSTVTVMDLSCDKSNEEENQIKVLEIETETTNTAYDTRKEDNVEEITRDEIVLTEDHFCN